MSDTVIRVENLGKKYVLAHQQNERYTTLRDSIAKGTKNLLKPFQNQKSQIQNPKSEEFWALKDVSFEIKQGDRVGIIGRNGAGKSTLLKILSRITEPTKGTIRIKGRVASLLEVGTGFHPELTGRENIYLNGAILGMSKVEIKRKFDEIVAFAEVEKFLDTPVKRYSSGMYVRLAFAVAAHLEPEILIVDEVLAVGDAQFQKKCLGKMENVAEKEGRTVLFVSHDMTAIEALCNQGIHLHQGQVMTRGDRNQIIQSYTSLIRHKDTEKGVLFSLKNENLKQDKFQVLKIELLDRFLEPCDAIKTGETLRLRVYYSAPMNLNEGAVVVEIFSELGSRLIHCSTQPVSNLELPFFIGETYIDCVIPSLPLAAGVYRVGVSLSIPMREWLYRELDLAILEVLPHDIYQSNFPPIQRFAPVAPPYFWDLPSQSNSWLEERLHNIPLKRGE